MKERKDLSGLWAALAAGAIVLAVIMVWMLFGGEAGAQVRGVTEAQVAGNARTFTARQVFDIIGAPTCAADPPVGACTAKDLCIDDTNNIPYFCKAGTWVNVGLDETDLTTTLRTFTAAQKFTHFTLAPYPPATVPLLRTEAPAVEFWTATGFSPSTGTQSVGSLTKPYQSAHVGTVNLGTALAAKVDNTIPAGTAQNRLTELHARELRGFCPGGPTAASGATICYDPDDPLGPAFKAMVGGQVLYVTVSATHP